MASEQPLSVEIPREGKSGQTISPVQDAPLLTDQGSPVGGLESPYGPSIVTGEGMIRSRKDRFHQAARDGYLDLLKEATRKDSDTPDEDGMTPVLWAAFCGHLDALRLSLSRGGNPDKCDYLGCSALHHAAINGHMHCVTFLVNFGVNVWTLDNDFQTALDLAVMREHHEIVTYLDSVCSRQSQLNQRVVRKLRERAAIDARKRNQKYREMQNKARQRAERENKRKNKKMSNGEAYTSLDAAQPQQSQLFSWRKENNKKQYSEHFSMALARSKHIGGSAAVKATRHKERGQLLDGQYRSNTLDTRSATGLRLRRDSKDSDILYGISEGTGRSARYSNNRPYSEPDIYNGGTVYDSGVGSYDSPAKETMSMFERPGFGNVAFFTRPRTTDAMMALPAGAMANGRRHHSDTTDGSRSPHSPRLHPPSSASLQRPPASGAIPRHHSNSSKPTTDRDSIGTAGSLLLRMSKLPWTEDDVEGLDDDDGGRGRPLELFLVAYGLTDYMSLLTREKLDLRALLLCTERDLTAIGLPLGPRRKILDAIAKRNQLQKQPGVMHDSYL